MAFLLAAPSLYSGTNFSSLEPNSEELDRIIKEQDKKAKVQKKLEDNKKKIRNLVQAARTGDVKKFEHHTGYLKTLIWFPGF